MLSREATKRPTANSSVSPGRIGKNRPHSMSTIARHTQRNQGPNWSSSQLGSIQVIPNSKGLVTPREYRSSPDQNLSSPPLSVVSAEEQRAPSAPMPNGPQEVGVGPWQGPLPTGEVYDEQLLAEGDRRNVVDRYRYWSMEAIVADLDTRRHDFHVAIENWQHDFNIGTIVRSANAFLAREVHIVGRKRWNRRGAMVTDRYQHVRHHESAEALASYLHGSGVALLGIDNLPGSQPLETITLPRQVCLVFGQEGPGVSGAARAACDGTFSIAQFGSTRSINASAAAAIAMHTWIERDADLGTAWRGGPCGAPGRGGRAPSRRGTG